MAFGRNGICLYIAVEFPRNKEIIYTYPSYNLIDDKWLCFRWMVQTVKNGEVDSGFIVNIKPRNIDNYWIPERINLELQKKDTKSTVYSRTYIIKNIILNKELQFQD
jgi:hypothetical protein